MRKIVAEGKLCAVVRFLEFIKESNNSSPINLLASMFAKKGERCENFPAGGHLAMRE